MDPLSSCRASPQQRQQRAVNGAAQASSMRCVLCGGPFRCPTPHDQFTACLSGLPTSFTLGLWCSMPARADKRKRGEPAAFYAHRDCLKLLHQKLDIVPQHSDIWPVIAEHTTKTDSIPDSLPASSYLGISELLEPFGTRSSPTLLSASFKPADSWMLYSPLVCTRNASRILTIWQPKLDKTQRSLAQRLALLLKPSASTKDLNRPTALSRPAAAAAAHPPAQPDLLDVLLHHSSMHHPQVVAKLHMSSKALSARIAATLAGRLRLAYRSCSTESVLSLALWLRTHAAILATLDISIMVSCCSEDMAAADTAIMGALTATLVIAPRLQVRSFSTTFSEPKLLASRRTFPCLDHITHLSVPDVSERQACRLPPHLVRLEVTRCTADVARLQMISSLCPNLREVVLGYNLWPNKASAGPKLLDHALNGWVLLPVVEMRFEGCRLPRGFTARSTSEPPYMSKAALAQLANLPGLTRLVFDGCCVDATVSHFASVLSRLTNLRALDLTEPSGVLTAEGSSLPRCFVDSTATLLEAAGRAGSGGVKQVSAV